MLVKERLLAVSRQRAICFLLFVLMFAITEIGRRFYRPYIYAHGIFDFWIADTIGNLTGTITIIFFQLAVINPEKRMGRVLSLIITVGLIGYELAQSLSPRSICDWKDIVATLVAGLMALGVYELLCRHGTEAIRDDETRPRARPLLMQQKRSLPTELGSAAAERQE